MKFHINLQEKKLIIIYFNGIILIVYFDKCLLIYRDSFGFSPCLIQLFTDPQG